MLYVNELYIKKKKYLLSSARIHTVVMKKKKDLGTLVPRINTENVG
jgi:hypothetical protein